VKQKFNPIHLDEKKRLNVCWKMCVPCWLWLKREFANPWVWSQLYYIAVRRVIVPDMLRWRLCTNFGILLLDN